jgi:hypothetical protein
VRPITQIHEIELSSLCNLACVYCPNPKLRRPKLNMDWGVYLRSLQCVRHFCERGTQGELALTGVGEALLHPRFGEALLLARACIGDRLLTFSTNGILLSDSLLKQIAPADPVIYVSLHRPEVAGLAIQRVRKHGLKLGVNAGFATSALDWAGQVDWMVTHKPQICEYLRAGWAVIRADGVVGTCCWDAESESGKIDVVWSDPLNWVTAPHKACARCSLQVPLEFNAREEQKSYGL